MSVSAQLGILPSTGSPDGFSEFVSAQQPQLERAISSPVAAAARPPPPSPTHNGGTPAVSSPHLKSSVGFNVLLDPPKPENSVASSSVDVQQLLVSKPPENKPPAIAQRDSELEHALPPKPIIQRADSMASNSSWNSAEGSSQEGRAYLDRSLLDLNAASKTRLYHLNDFFNRMKIGGDEASFHLQRAFATPASDISSSYQLSQFEISMPVAEALQALLKDRSILVHGTTLGPNGMVATEMVWSREHLFERCLQLDDLSAPLAAIASNMPAVPTIAAHDTLDMLIECLYLHGVNQVATVDEEGGVTGVVYFEDVYERVVEDIKSEWQAGGGGDQNETKREFRHIASIGWESSESENLEPRQPMTMRETMSLRRSVGRAQKSAQAWVETAWTELMVMYLLALDISCTIFEVTQDSPEVGTANPLNIVTGCILSVFLFEAAVRIYGYRWTLLDGSRLLDSLDLLVVIASVIVYCIVITETTSAQFADAVTAARILRFFRLVKIVKRVRRILYANKWRYQKNGFDLNLTYVTPACIAMSLPASGTEANFYNPIDDVARFFTTIHEKHFLIFNLCAERSYDITLFNGRVEKIDVEDLNPPKLHQLVSMLTRMAAFTEEDPSNVVAVHSRTGRSRTGVVVCAWLLYCGFSDAAADALTYFSKQRAGDKANPHSVVQGPSQRRYIHYVEEMLAAGGYRANKMILMGITMLTCPKTASNGGCRPWFIVEQDERVVYNSSDHRHPELMSRNEARKEFDGMRVGLMGDVRIIFYDGDPAEGPRDMLFFLWFHTGFMKQRRVAFSKDMIDMACHDAQCKMFNDTFGVELLFEGRDDVEENNSGPATPLEGQQSPALLGLWRKVEGPSKVIVERNKRYRGREQELVAEGREIKITLQDGARTQSVDDAGEGDALTPLDDNLSSASGPPVVHNSVRMYSVAGGGEVHGNKQAKKLMEYYKKGGGDTGGALVKKARALVSGQKRRFQEDGFDLDLTYITPRLIAMGYPSKGVEGSYRNSESEVYRFFQERHAGHFRIINLCSERAYDLDIFHGSVARYPFPDHNPPALELILPACAHIHTFLQENENHVCAVHCKAGKGRTGLIMISYLLYGGLRRTALSARAFYDSQRTYDKKGLTIISQIRYAHYFEEQLRRIKQGRACAVSESKSPAVRLWRLRLHTIPHMDRDRGCDPVMTVSVKCEFDFEEYELYRTKDHQEPKHYMPSDSRCDLDIGTGGAGLRVAGDVHIVVGHDSQSFMGKPTKMFFVWVHTAFVQHPPPDMGGSARELSAEECTSEGLPARSWCLTLSKPEIDQAAQDSKNAKFDAEFSVDLFFTAIPEEVGTGEGLEGQRRRGKKSSGKQQLYEEKTDYQRYVSSCQAVGKEAEAFERWLMNNQQQQARQRMLSFGGSKGSLSTASGSGPGGSVSSMRPGSIGLSSSNSVRSAGSSLRGKTAVATAQRAASRPLLEDVTDDDPPMEI